MTNAFEKLWVFQKSVDFPDRVWAITSDFSVGYHFLANPWNRFRACGIIWAYG